MKPLLTGMNLTQAKVDSIIQAPKQPTNNVKHVRYVVLGIIFLIYPVCKIKFVKINSK